MKNIIHQLYRAFLVKNSITDISSKFACITSFLLPMWYTTKSERMHYDCHPVIRRSSEFNLQRDINQSEDHKAVLRQNQTWRLAWKQPKRFFNIFLGIKFINEIVITLKRSKIWKFKNVCFQGLLNKKILNCIKHKIRKKTLPVIFHVKLKNFFSLFRFTCTILLLFFWHSCKPESQILI